MTDHQDDPAINLPPPLIYAVPLVLGLVLKRRVRLPFLSHGAPPACADPRGIAWVWGPSPGEKRRGGG